jgi:hypothetical protein
VRILHIFRADVCFGAAKNSVTHNGDTDMNAKLLLPVIAAALFPLGAYAHDCSGGADGGMDATGNQCNAEIVASAASSEPQTWTSTRVMKIEAKKAATKDRIATRNASVHTRIKRS